MDAGRLSNDQIEGINRKIKQIKRIAYGYKNWEHIIFRIRIEFEIEKGIQFENELDSHISPHQHRLTKKRAIKLPFV